MSFTTPTVDVYVPGTTLGIGNVNAGTINIGKAGTTINVGGSMAVTNSVTTPSCTMTSLTTGNLIISPFSGDVAFNNFSARNATIGNASFMNASFNTLNSSNILIGPYPVSGAFTNVNVINASIANASISNLSSTNINVLNASMTYINVSGFLINPLPSDPTFTSINTPNIDVNANGTLTLGNQNATAVYIGSSATRNVINNIGTGSGTGTIYIGNNTNSIQLNGQTTLAKPLTLQAASGYVAPTTGQLGSIITASFAATTTLTSSTWVSSPAFTIPPGNYILNTNIRPRPGYTSGAIFTGAYISITSGTLNTGTSYYYIYDSTTKPNLTYGIPPYLAMYSYSAVFTCATTLTLYLNFQGVYSVSGSNQAPELNTTDSVYFMRIE